MSDGIQRRPRLGKSLFLYGICLVATLFLWLPSFMSPTPTQPDTAPTATQADIAPESSMAAVAIETVPTQAKLATELLTIRRADGKTMPFTVEIARTQQEQAIGLMGRKEVLSNEGMLFAYPDVMERNMWMHNTLVSLDMLFIDAAGKIVRLVPKATPLSDTVIPSNGPVKAVLELRGGVAEAYGIREGDTVLHAHFPPASTATK